MEEEERSQSNNSMPVYSARLARESMGGGSGRGETVQIVVFITPSLRRLNAVSTPSLRLARSVRSSSPSPPIDEAKAAIPRPRGLKASRRDRERERSEKRAERSERESRDSEKEARKEREKGTGIKGVSPITTALPGSPDDVPGIYPKTDHFRNWPPSKLATSKLTKNRTDPILIPHVRSPAGCLPGSSQIFRTT